MATSIISIDMNYASNVRIDGIVETFQHTVSRAEFLSQFGDLDLANVRSLAYEPEQNFYHIVDGNGVLSAFASPSEDSRINYVHSNLAGIEAWFEDKKSEEQQA